MKLEALRWIACAASISVTTRRKCAAAPTVERQPLGHPLDHLPSAWERRAQRKPLRLKDIEVVCGECNRARGSSRPESTGGRPLTSTFPRRHSRGARYTRREQISREGR
jgi:hypothetical protein